MRETYDFMNFSYDTMKSAKLRGLHGLVGRVGPVGAWVRGCVGAWVAMVKICVGRVGCRGL